MTTTSKRIKLTDISTPDEILAPFMDASGYGAKEGMTKKLSDARKAWLAAKMAEINAQPNREATIVGNGSYQRVSVYEIREVAGVEQRRATCQCCGTDVAIDKHDRTAHHGYERPGTGWQTDSCNGARHLCYELGHDQLDLTINAGPTMIARAQLAIDQANEWTGPLMVREGWGRQAKMVEVESTDHRWQGAKEDSMRKAGRNMVGLREYLEFVTARRAAWKLNPSAIRTIAVAR